MIGPLGAISAVNSLPSPAGVDSDHASFVVALDQKEPSRLDPDPVLCSHCGRTASNGLVCIGMCVADSGY